MATYHFSNTPQPTIKDTNRKINSMSHFRYITREGSYDNGRQDLVYKETGNLPDWAKNEKDFWKQAEKNRRSNGRSYREIRVALPEELSVEENKALVDKLLVAAHIKDDHVYTYVIHDKVAAFDPDHNNIHAHIMFNERKIEHDRPIHTAKEFFSRHNVTLGDRESGKGAGVVSGGYAVDRWFSQRDTTIFLRKEWERLVNEALKEKGLDTRVSADTLEKQRERLEAEGKTQEAMFLDRPVAPRLMNGYKKPFTLKKIHEQIAFYKKALDNDTAPEVSNENIIDLFARDVALRQKARQIQYEQKQAMKANLEIAQQEKERLKKDDPMVVTVKNLRDVFTHSHTAMIAKLEKLTAQYEATKGEIIPKANMERAALNILTDGRYQESMEEYKRISKEYKIQQEKAELYVHDKEKYDKHLEQMVLLRKERNKAWDETQSYKDKFINSDRTALDNMIQKIEDYNKEKDEESKNIYRNIRQTSKLLNASAHILETLKTLPDDHIAYSEKLPSLINMNTKLNGETPLKELPRLSYQGKIYIVIDGKNPKEVKAVRLYDEAVKGEATVYKLTREEKDGKLHTTSAEATDEKVKTYKVHEYNPKKSSPETSQSQTASRNPQDIINGVANTMLSKEILNTPRAPKVNVPDDKDRDMNMTEAEKAVEKMYEEWNAGFSRRRLLKVNRMRVEKAKQLSLLK